MRTMPEVEYWRDFDRNYAKGMFYRGRGRCTTRAKKTEAKRRAKEWEALSWLCDCGAWVEGPFHCSFCATEPPYGCHGECCQGYEEADDAWDDGWHDDTCDCDSCCGDEVDYEEADRDAG